MSEGRRNRLGARKGRRKGGREGGREGGSRFACDFHNPRVPETQNLKAPGPHRRRLMGPRSYGAINNRKASRDRGAMSAIKSIRSIGTIRPTRAIIGMEPLPTGPIVDTSEIVAI